MLGNFQNAITELNKQTLSVKPIQRALAEENYASKFCEKLISQIREFDSNLDSTKQVAVQLVSFGQTVTFNVEKLGYSDPSLIYFFGTLPDGNPVQLVQHISQISFLLLASNRENPEEPKRPIGFRHVD